MKKHITLSLTKPETDVLLRSLGHYIDIGLELPTELHIRNSRRPGKSIERKIIQKIIKEERNKNER